MGHKNKNIKKKNYRLSQKQKNNKIQNKNNIFQTTNKNQIKIKLPATKTLCSKFFQIPIKEWKDFRRIAKNYMKNYKRKDKMIIKLTKLYMKKFQEHSVF